MNTDQVFSAPRQNKVRLTYALLAACVVVFALQSIWFVELLNFAALWPLGSQWMPWQLFSYAFLHGSFNHLLFNMIGVWMFGRELEMVFGTTRFALLYFVSVLVAALVQLLAIYYSGSIDPTVGASGGLFGLLIMFALLFPNRKMILLILPVPIPAWLFVSLYASAELFFGISGTLTSIAHFAHLGGLLGGFLVYLFLRKKLVRKQANF